MSFLNFSKILCGAPVDNPSSTPSGIRRQMKTYPKKITFPTEHVHLLFCYHPPALTRVLSLSLSPIGAQPWRRPRLESLILIFTTEPIPNRHPCIKTQSQTSKPYHLSPPNTAVSSPSWLRSSPTTATDRKARTRTPSSCGGI